jgi:hypothetical protein
MSAKARVASHSAVSTEGSMTSAALGGKGDGGCQEHECRD